MWTWILFSPTVDFPSQVAAEFFSRGGSGLGVFLLILPKDRGNALRLEVLDEALQVRYRVVH